MKIGTAERPLLSAEPMKVARQLRGDVYGVEQGQGLWFMRGLFWEWYGGKWVERDRGEVERRLYRELEDAFVCVEGKGGSELVRYQPTGRKLEEVVGAMEAVAECPFREMPVWLGGVGKWKVEECVAFEDVVVHVPTGETEVRDQRWLDHVVVPVEWGGEGKCERWMQCLEEWSGGDESWVELLRRWMGYCLMNHRRYAKWLLMEGKSRAGKGVVGSVVLALLGRRAVLTQHLKGLTGQFSMDGMEHARVLWVPEGGRLDKGEGQEAARVWKQVLGEDPITVDVKYRRQVMNVRCMAAPMMASNMIPLLPNEGQGLTTKMLVLPFTRSFDDREKGGPQPEAGLKDRLVTEELGGIARWAMGGARALWEAKSGERWPKPAEAAKVEYQFRVENNPIDAFLEARFQRNREGFVSNALVWEAWEDFSWATESSIRIPRNKLGARMVEEGTWGLRIGKRGAGDNRVRGVYGLSLLKETRDEGWQD